LTVIRRIAKNTSVLFISQISSYVLMFIYVIYTARYLGAEGFGILSLALAFTGIFGILADMGLSQLTTREVSRDKSLTETYIVNITGIKIILSVLTLIISAIILNLLNYQLQTFIVVYFLILYAILFSFSKIFYSIFQAYENMEYQSISTFLNTLLILILTLTAIYFKMGVVIFAFIYIIVGIFILIFNIALCKWKFNLPKIEFDMNFWKKSIKEGFFFGFAGFFTEIYFNIDSVMISIILGTAAVGWYNAAYRIIFVLMFIPSALIVSLFPVMSKYFQSKKGVLKAEYEKIFKYIFVTSILILIYGLIFSDKIILIIYGNAYIPSILALQVLIWVIPFIFLTFLFGNLLAAINKQMLVTIVAGANALLNVGLNIILIPIYGLIGASVATVITEALGFILMFSYISKNFSKLSLVHNIIKPVIGGIFTASIIYFLKMEINWILAGISGLIVYVIILYLLKIIDDDDFKIFRNIF